MLEKKAGIKKIHLLQIICLVEANFNTALKLYFAKHLVSNSEKTELIQEQSRGHPSRQVTDSALHKMLLFEHGRALYVTMTLFVNGVTACFDSMAWNPT